MWWQESAIPTLLSQDAGLRQNYPEALGPANPESITAETTRSLASPQGGLVELTPDLHAHAVELLHSHRETLIFKIS